MYSNIFTVLYFACVIAASFIRGVFARQFKQERHIPDRLDRLLTVLPVFGMLIFPLIYTFTSWLDFADYRLPLWAGGMGMLIFSLGLWLLWRSHADLGRQWSVNVEMQEQHKLVTGGVFSRIRHPMYAAHLLWGLAQPLLLWNWIAGLSMLVFSLPLYIYRIPREEKMMTDAFGGEYQEYMQDTGRFFPKI
jgi:protein-S-isoprenylcysteine O-methyltransferase Ste14